MPPSPHQIYKKCCHQTFFFFFFKLFYFFRLSLLQDAINEERHNKGGSCREAGKIQEVSVVRTGSHSKAVCEGAASCQSSQISEDKSGTGVNRSYRSVRPAVAQVLQNAALRHSRNNDTWPQKTHTHAHSPNSRKLSILELAPFVPGMLPNPSCKMMSSALFNISMCLWCFLLVCVCLYIHMHYVLLLVWC